tara:strand:+ start:319 stop:654 length:336 start_codon:yes stop_codon:yes gene_type:complete
MNEIVIFAQIVVSVSVLIIWIFRYENIVVEFKQFGINNLLRNLVGALKISLSTMLIIGIWYNEFILPSAILMAFLMLCAQAFHFRVKNKLYKYLPSFSLLILSLLIAYNNL